MKTKKSNQKRKKVFALVGLLVVLAICGALTYAWFVSSAGPIDQNVQAARIKLTDTLSEDSFNIGGFTDYLAVALPGEFVSGAAVTITNDSTREAIARVDLKDLTGYLKVENSLAPILSEPFNIGGTKQTLEDWLISEYSWDGTLAALIDIVVKDELNYYDTASDTVRAAIDAVKANVVDGIDINIKDDKFGSNDDPQFLHSANWFNEYIKVDKDLYDLFLAMPYNSDITYSDAVTNWLFNPAKYAEFDYTDPDFDQDTFNTANRLVALVFHLTTPAFSLDFDKNNTPGSDPDTTMLDLSIVHFYKVLLDIKGQILDDDTLATQLGIKNASSPSLPNPNFTGASGAKYVWLAVPSDNASPSMPQYGLSVGDIGFVPKDVDLNMSYYIPAGLGGFTASFKDYLDGTAYWDTMQDFNLSEEDPHYDGPGGLDDPDQFDFGSSFNWSKDYDMMLKYNAMVSYINEQESIFTYGLDVLAIQGTAKAVADVFHEDNLDDGIEWQSIANPAVTISGNSSTIVTNDTQGDTFEGSIIAAFKDLLTNY